MMKDMLKIYDAAAAVSRCKSQGVLLDFSPYKGGEKEGLSSCKFNRNLTSCGLNPCFVMLARIIGAVSANPPSSRMCPLLDVIRKDAMSDPPTW
jgi:hypothetical protein